ncbi:hypothetical protein RHMOL_Rhmol03G0274400 [Rhododendron molle]|uniref:Uncharacterized protein n=1 Tax=Rhododendron molle TaxID=49168 RepID=A0ACC0PKD7_RHOML|nr:hypothetical protein RHMOL_Rhmol03G0274400 [Rhododendron molle]
MLHTRPQIRQSKTMQIPTSKPEKRRRRRTMTPAIKRQRRTRNQPAKEEGQICLVHRQSTHRR